MTHRNEELLADVSNVCSRNIEIGEFSIRTRTEPFWARQDKTG
eukprot:COSAG02_NODE_56793_length_283_cov_1.619565_1_plen_42_part_01